MKVVRKDELLQNIYTTASYCNSFILKPFCWISKSHYFYTRKYLDHKELERDVLRVRIFYWKRGYRETEVDTAVVPRGSNKVGVTFSIKEGPPILVSNVVVNQAVPLLSLDHRYLRPVRQLRHEHCRNAFSHRRDILER